MSPELPELLSHACRFLIAALFVVCSGCAQHRAGATETAPGPAVVPADASGTGPCGHISRWPPKYAEKLKASEPVLRTLTSAIIDKDSDAWSGHVTPPEAYLKSLTAVAEMTRTPFAYEALEKAKRDGGKAIHEESKESIRKGLDRIRTFLASFEVRLGPNAEARVWPSDEPNLFLRPSCKTFWSPSHVIMGNNVLEFRSEEKSAFVVVDGFFYNGTYYLDCTNVLGLVTVGRDRAYVTILIWPEGYNYWDESMPIPVPPMGIDWYGPTGKKGVGFLVRTTVGWDGPAAPGRAELIMLHMDLADGYARDAAFLAATQTACKGQRVTMTPGERVFKKCSEDIAKLFPNVKLEEMALELWRERPQK